MTPVAVVYKFSALESYSPRQIRRHRELNPDLGKRLESAHDEHSQSLEKLRALLTRLGVEADFHERDGLSQSLDNYRLVISIGGDGTFINASHFTEKALLIGVNSSPANSVGHYCRFHLSSAAAERAFQHLFEALLRGKKSPVREQELIRIQVHMHDRPVGFPVLNDVLFCEENPAATSRYTLRYRGGSHHQKSSGIWISTPTGSTAAYSSAGGQEFKKRELRFLVRELYSDSARSVQHRPAASRAASLYPRGKRLLKGNIRSGEKLHIVSSMMHGALYLDGSHHKVPVALGEHVRIAVHPHALRAIY